MARHISYLSLTFTKLWKKGVVYFILQQGTWDLEKLSKAPKDKGLLKS